MFTLKKVATIEITDASESNNFDGTLVFPAELFSEDCSWCAFATHVPSEYDTKMENLYGRIPLFFSGFTHGDSKMYGYFSHVYISGGTADAVLNTDGTMVLTGTSGRRLYNGIKYDVYKSVMSWG